MSIGSGRQRGIAVITAMLVVTIATILAVEIAWQTNLDVRRTEGLFAWEQAREVGLGAEIGFATRFQEALDERSGNPLTYSRKAEFVACGDGLSFTFDVGEVKGAGSMTGYVCDLQGRFNLNNLYAGGQRQQAIREQFARLLRAVAAIDERMADADIDKIADSTLDWLDGDTGPEGAGAEDDIYSSREPAYVTGNFWFTTASEWRAVDGVDANVYAAMRPYLAALPPSQKPTLLNVNTASIPLYASLGDNVPAEQWFEDSKVEDFTDNTRFAADIEPALLATIGFDSEYFGLEGVITLGTTQLGMYSLLRATGQAVVPLQRSFGAVDLRPVTEDEEEADGDEDDEGSDDGEEPVNLSDLQ